MEEFNFYTFPNGIRVVHKEIKSTKLVHCGFVLDIGSRDERAGEEGIAHFWEHMVFKGTSRRKSFHILNRLDAVGGELNAFTTKEKIAFHASVLADYFEKAIDLLTDITFDSVFPEKQIEKERNVILEEMAMYLDSPEDAIQDEFDHVVFDHHPLGNNILGTVDSVKRFKRKDFNRFVDNNMNTERVIFAVVGPLGFGKVKRLAEKYLKDIPHRRGNRIRLPFSDYRAKFKEFKKPITQSQSAIGRTAYPMTHERRLPFYLLTNILGGPAMNTRLNMGLREKYGWVYAIDASYASYADTALFAIFFGTDPKFLRKCQNEVFKELRKLKEKQMGVIQLHRAKEQFVGQMAMAEENNLSMMLMMGRSLLDFNRIESMETTFNKVQAVDAALIMDMANEIFDFEQMSMLTYLPAD